MMVNVGQDMSRDISINTKFPWGNGCFIERVTGKKKNDAQLQLQTRAAVRTSGLVSSCKCICPTNGFFKMFFDLTKATTETGFGNSELIKNVTNSQADISLSILASFKIIAQIYLHVW